ncbi:fatty acid desaturase family protein [Rhizobium sp. CF142]|uniref:fatty acid desaturase family protein n=1 Tax=Rhizobium sp. CF142 TaxID=1144314 RepID=UPI00026EFF12|nr:fatty acid desaturase family protein [Rhizobium sp. CF142]EJJ28062.1 fatty acid desaturase [Rhizobium sp. CF142]
MDARFNECMRVARKYVDSDTLESLKKPRPFAILTATSLIWLQVAASWAIALLGPWWLVWLPFVVNCAVTQAMLLWVHEASHFHLYSNRRNNDLWCDVFFAAPVGMSVAAYRFRHMSHHAHLGSEQDADGYPYRQSIKGLRALAWVMVKALSGCMGLWLAIDKYGGVARKNATVSSVSPSWVAPLVTLVFNGMLLTLCVAVGRWYLYIFLWGYPIVGVAIALNIIRTIAEHQPEDYPSYEDGKELTMMPVARTTVPNWFEKWLMYQANFNYHVEHHLFPAIPQHNLTKLHKHLFDKGFYDHFPGNLQQSGFVKFIHLSRNRRNDDFSDPVEDALAV